VTENTEGETTDIPETPIVENTEGETTDISETPIVENTEGETTDISETPIVENTEGETTDISDTPAVENTEEAAAIGSDPDVNSNVDNQTEMPEPGFVPEDPNQQNDEIQTGDLTKSVIYTITNNSFTDNKPIVIWAAQKGIFCGL
jgi:hypothetical protein